MRLLCVSAVFAAALFVLRPSACRSAEKPFGLKSRVPLTTSRVVGYPDPLPPYRAKSAFPHLKFKSPLHVVREPGSDRLLIVERFGKIYEITHDRKTRKPQLFLDVGRESYSMCFHPTYAENGYIYVFSNATFDGKKAEPHLAIHRSQDRQTPARQDIRTADHPVALQRT